MSQNEKILKHLKAGKRLTPLTALKAGCGMRLSARILELRQAGYQIRTAMVRKGRSRVAEYSM